MFTHPSLGSNEHLVSSTWYPLQGVQVHTASDTAIKKKRPLLKNHSEANQTVSHHDEIRYRTNSHMVYYLPHTPFTLYVAETNDNRISTPKRPEQHHTRRNLLLLSKREINCIYCNCTTFFKSFGGARLLQQCSSVTVSKGGTFFLWLVDAWLTVSWFFVIGDYGNTQYVLLPVTTTSSPVLVQLSRLSHAPPGIDSPHCL